MDRQTVEIYEHGAALYAERRKAYNPERAEAFARSLDEGVTLRLDLGCGPGHYLPHLGGPLVAADASPAMVTEARRLHADRAPHAGVVCDLESLPFARGVLGGVWASKCLQHVTAERLPLALGGLHRILDVGGVLDLTVFAGDGADVSDREDDFPGRWFTWWQPEPLRHLLIGAGFEVMDIEVGDGRGEHRRLTAVARRARSLADTVGPDMRVLVCGLNPSLYAADAGVGFARPGNRFWPAARAAGLVSVDRDPVGALQRDGVGMTDLVKRATVAAAELTTDEYRDGLRRIEHLVGWLRPKVVVFVGLAGWRAAVDSRAVAGFQPEALAGVPVYVMPSTSGLNAAYGLPSLTEDFRRAAALADLHAGDPDR